MNKTMLISIFAIIVGSLSFLLPADTFNPAVPPAVVNASSNQPASTSKPINKKPTKTGAIYPTQTMGNASNSDGLGPLDGRRFKGGANKDDE